MSMRSPNSSRSVHQLGMLLRPGIPQALVDTHSTRIPLADSPDALLVVCDGLRSAGAANEILALFNEQSAGLVELAETPPAERSKHPLQVLQEIVFAANLHACKNAPLRALGAPRIALTALLIVGQRGYIANVGSSGLYLINNGKVLTIIEADSAGQAICLGDQPNLTQLSQSGRPDFVHSFVIDLAIEDRLVLCTSALARQLAVAQLPPAAAVGARALRSAGPTQAALDLSQDYQSSAAQVLWRPLRYALETPQSQRPTALQGGAIIVWCADAMELNRVEQTQRRRHTVQSVFTFLALFIFVTGLFAGMARFAEAQQRAVATASATPTQAPGRTLLPTATALAATTHSPQPTLPGITVTARATRTSTVTAIPTLTFTPSPTPTPTSTPTPTAIPPPPSPTPTTRRSR